MRRLSLKLNYVTRKGGGFQQDDKSNSLVFNSEAILKIKIYSIVRMDRANCGVCNNSP